MDLKRELVNISIMHSQSKLIHSQSRMLDLNCLFLGALVILFCSVAFVSNLLEGRIWVCVIEAILIAFNVWAMVKTIFRMIREHKRAKEEDKRYVAVVNSLNNLIKESENGNTTN